MPTVQFKDYYQTLGIPRDADEKAVRAAYRKLARKHHPDINPGDRAAEERFKEINEAHEVLADPAKRKMYDRYGEDWQRYRDAGFTGDEPAGRAPTAGSRVDPSDFGSWFSGQTGGSRPDGFRVEYQSADEGGFSDFFQTLFGRRGERAGDRFGTGAVRPRRGEDYEAGVEITFDEAFRGATRAFDVQTVEPCPTCNGTGIARGATCPACDGTGTVPRTKTLEVRIPAGIATGARVRVAGQGGPGRDGPNGDVYLRVTVLPDPRFERDGDDLRTEIEVPLYTALLGGEAEVPTPTGRVALTIPPGSQTGRVFRLRGQGMPRLKGKGTGTSGRGDLLARLRVVLPTELTEEEQALVRQLRDLRQGKR